MENAFGGLRRVAVYCRVSTDREDQANSLESQKKYFSRYIEQNPLWQLVKIYVDEGVTGTSTKKRRAFNQMLADAEGRAFDLLVTKEISRFARNTLDSILYTRRLKELGIGVIFMNDNINTLEPDAELRLTIMSSIAQEESRRTSQRVKWGQRRRMEQGVVFGRDLLGYDVRKGKLYVNEKGAETVRLIFHKFMNQGKGTHVIARELREAGAVTSTYMKEWSSAAILRVLRNEKYCGDLKQKKTFTSDYLTHEKKYNRGQEDYVIIRDHHKPIINREMFDRVQRELDRRAAYSRGARHSGRHCFSGKIKCGVCGRSFACRIKGGYKGWRCLEAIRNGAHRVELDGSARGCSCPSLNDRDAKDVLLEIVAGLSIDRAKILKELTGTLQRSLSVPPEEWEPEGLRREINKISEKKRRLLDLHLDGEIPREEFIAAKERLIEEEGELGERLAELEKQGVWRPSREERLKEISLVLEELCGGAKWDDTFYRHILDKITVYQEGGLEVELKRLTATWRFLRGG